MEVAEHVHSDGGIRGGDDQQPRPCGGIFLRGGGVCLLHGGHLVPAVEQRAVGHLIDLGQRQVIEARHADAFAAVAAQTRKHGQLRLILAGHSVCLDIHPLVLGLVDAFGKDIDVRDGQVRAAPFIQRIPALDIAGKTVDGARLDGDGLQEARIVIIEILDLHAVLTIRCVIRNNAVERQPDGGQIRIGIPVSRQTVAAQLLEAGVAQQVGAVLLGGGNAAQEQQCQQERQELPQDFFHADAPRFVIDFRKVEKRALFGLPVFKDVSRLRTRPEGRKTDEVRGRPLDCFAMHTHVTGY